MAGRQLGRVLDQEAGAGVERALHAIGHGDRIAAPDDVEAWARQAVGGAPSRRQHRVAAMRQAVHAHQPRRLQLGHAGLDTSQHVAQPLRGEGRGELEGGELVGLVDGAQAVGRGSSSGRRH